MIVSLVDIGKSSFFGEYMFRSSEDRFVKLTIHYSLQPPPSAQTEKHISRCEQRPNQMMGALTTYDRCRTGLTFSVFR